MFKPIAVAMLVLVTALLAGLTTQTGSPESKSFLVIAHRGASGYLPEHTLAAYAMAFATSRARPTTTGAVMVLAAATSMIATAPRPQMLNLQALDGISFNKGCYMGQETVARAKYRGANNRALFLLAGTAGEPVASGDTLELQLGDNWRRSGMVLNAWQQAGQVWLTAVLPKDTEADALFRLKQDEGSRLTVQPLPYTLTE